MNCGVQVEDSQGKVGVLDVVARFRVRNMSGYVTVYYSFADTADTAEQVGCDWSPGQPCSPLIGRAGLRGGAGPHQRRHPAAGAQTVLRRQLKKISLEIPTEDPDH